MAARLERRPGRASRPDRRRAAAPPEPFTPHPEVAMFAFKTILHPTDFSAPSEYAFRLAASLARDHGARLIVLHVEAPEPGVVPAMAVPPAPPPVYSDEVWEEFPRLAATDPRLREVHIRTELPRASRSRRSCGPPGSTAAT